MKMRITVEDTSYEVEVEVLDDDAGAHVISTRRAEVPRVSAAPSAAPVTPAAEPRAVAVSTDAGPSGKQVKSPIAGMVQSVAVKAGDRVEVNDTLLVLEAMKMESCVASPIAGTIRAVHAEAGQAVRMADVLVEFE